MASHTCARCSSSSGSAFWFVRRSNKMSDPRNQAWAQHQHLEGKSLSHVIFDTLDFFYRQTVTGQATMALNRQRTG